jgi:hypothetical protein
MPELVVVRAEVVEVDHQHRHRAGLDLVGQRFLEYAVVEQAGQRVVTRGLAELLVEECVVERDRRMVGIEPGQVELSR